MEERMGIPDICPGKPDDPCQNAGARVGGKADNEVTDQIVTGLYVVESRKAVEPGQLVIDEPGDLDHVVRTRVGDKEVLRTQLNDLLPVLEIIAVDVFGIPKFAHPFD